LPIHFVAEQQTRIAQVIEDRIVFFRHHDASIRPDRKLRDRDEWQTVESRVRELAAGRASQPAAVRRQRPESGRRTHSGLDLERPKR
jgi:hypothetical protein